jgi:hypothetical protein
MHAHAVVRGPSLVAFAAEATEYGCKWKRPSAAPQAQSRIPVYAAPRDRGLEISEIDEPFRIRRIVPHTVFLDQA